MADADKPAEDLRDKNVKEKLELLQKVVNLSPNIFFVIDLRKQKIVFVSRKVKELFGHDAEYFLNYKPDIFRHFIHPDDYDLRMQNLTRCQSLAEEEECEVEVRLLADGGKWEWYRIKEKIFTQDERGAVSHVLGTAQNIHEQKIGEERLREEHRRLENAQKIGHIGSFERKLPGNIMICSEEFYHILGIDPKPEGLTVEDFYSFVHPDDRQTLLTAVEKTHSTGQAFDTITRIVRPDKTIRHVHRRAALIKDQNDVPQRVYGTMQDITERVRAEKEKKRVEKLMHATEALAGTGSYEVDIINNTVFFSDGLFLLFGEKPQSFVPSLEWIDKRTHPEDVALVKKTITRAIKKKSTYVYKRRIFHKDGSIRYLEVHGKTILNSRGELKKLIGLVQDVTSRMAAQKEIERSENRSRELLEVLQNAPDAYLVLSRDLHIEMASDAYIEVTQTSRKDIIGKYLFDAFPDNPELPDASGVRNLHASLKKVLATKQRHRMPIQHYDVRDKSGAFIEKYWSPTNTPVINAKGQVEYIIHRVIDVTDVLQENNTVKGLVSESEMLKTSLEEVKIQAQQLKESRALLQSVFDASPSSIILYNTIFDDKGEPQDFEFLMVNAFNQRVLEIPSDVTGKRLSELYPHVITTGIMGHFKTTMKTGESADFEVWYDGDGFQSWFHFRAVKLNDLLLATAEDITERKIAEKEVIQLKEELTQKATDKYRKIINSMDEGFCIIEIIRDETGACVDYKYLATNPVFEEQTGLKDVLGRSINELVPDIEDYWKRIYGEVARTGNAIRFEDYAEALGRWFDVNAFRIDSPNEQHVALIFKDITERKEAEERKTFLLNLNEAIRPLEDPVKIKDTAMRFLGQHLEVDMAYFIGMFEDEDTILEKEGFHKELDPLVGKKKISDFSPELLEQLQRGETVVIEDLYETYKENEQAREQINSSQVKAAVIVPLRRNSQLVAVISVQHSSPRKWNSKEVALVEEVCEQIWTAIEKAQAEKSLRESEQRFRNLVEASALAVWETEPDGKIIKDSTSWRAFTGQSNEEWEGEGWLNAVYEEDRAFAERAWKEATATKTKLDMEYRLISATGEARWTSVKAVPIFDIDGKVTKWTGMNIDIHDQKQAEEALIFAKEEAEEASRAKEDFLSTMSHEIRTPLNAVIGLTNLLLDKNPREDQKENLNSLSFSAKNLLALINDILDFSKLEAGKAEVTMTDFDLPGLLMNLKQAHQPIADHQQTELEVNFDDRIPARISADQLKLSQVLHNLVSNAVKFTSRGKVVINVNLEEQQHDTYWLNFEVKDTGIGISSEKLEHIFEKFAQAESSTVRQYGGTGLGLSITRLLLELMDSKIKVESTPAHGSRFYFSLAVKKAEVKEEIPALSEDSPSHQDLRDLKILLVEDVEINRKIIIQFLQNWWQLQPDEAINGKEAVEMAAAKRYDMVLMDIRMPVMDGYESTLQIRKLPGYANVPVLALTADKNHELEHPGKRSRFDGLLTKPFEPLDLKKKILLQLSRPVEEEQQPSPFKDLSAEELGEREELKKLIVQQLEEYKATFIQGVQENDVQKLKDLEHKSKVVFELTNLKYLSKNLQKLISDLELGTERDVKNPLFEEIKKALQDAIDKLKTEAEPPPFEISRYEKIAGNNEIILQKLIVNSVKAMELYRTEFSAAANAKDLEALSDLVHKNTTSVHYLQANALARKINDFRSFLEDNNSEDDELRRKKEEVITEFQKIIKGLKRLEK
ncbi:PAS domain-containing protein [Salinimicrobium oceani]|uniref:histidine kinase n=1 Tax=Salinimicrobium oceani TaxID=2722702 RepID=A0ABX1CZC9_9FLAO|nr:PAS domain-containing protein [Salinimicrobium oceani]NJW52472.1 PAS domain-containing protein [Salinimicrobium oceani]